MLAEEQNHCTDVQDQTGELELVANTEVQEVKGRMREESKRPLPTPGPGSLEEEEQEGRRGKQAMILKNPADDLGMAIIGGREHNLPIIISEIFPGTAVARSNRVGSYTHAAFSHFYPRSMLETLFSL